MVTSVGCGTLVIRLPNLFRMAAFELNMAKVWTSLPKEKKIWVKLSCSLRAIWLSAYVSLHYYGYVKQSTNENTLECLRHLQYGYLGEGFIALEANKEILVRIHSCKICKYNKEIPRNILSTLWQSKYNCGCVFYKMVYIYLLVVDILLRKSLQNPFNVYAYYSLTIVSKPKYIQ